MLPIERNKRQEELHDRLSKYLTRIVEIATSPYHAGGLEASCRQLFDVIRAGKTLGLLLKEVDTSSRSLPSFLKEIRALGRITTPDELRALIVSDLKKRRMPEGLCNLLELGVNPQQPQNTTEEEETD